jgi:hypothetical protein
MGYAVTLSALFIRKKICVPSDFFGLIYTLFVIIPFSALIKIRGEIGEQTLIFGTVLISTPLLMVAILNKLRLQIHSPAVFSENLLKIIICGLALGSTLLLLNSGIESAGFDMTTSYDRRLEGREVFETGALASYMMAMLANSLLPLIAFWAGYFRNLVLLFVAAVGASALFFYLGLKAPFFYILIAACFGWYLQKYDFTNVLRVFVLGVVALFMGAFIEHFFWGYSYLADYVIRRAFSVPPYLLSAYLEMFFHTSGYWDIASGNLSSEPITMEMGAYLGDPTMNANTNSFFYALGSWGVKGYILDILLVCSVLWVTDALYRTRQNPALLWVGFLFSLLLIEQSSKTVLISSGVALSILLLFLGAATNPKVR